MAAFPENLLDSEQFGNERGGSRGPTGAGPAGFEAGDGGTLFLDEAGGRCRSDLPAKLIGCCRRQIVRSAPHATRVDVRLVLATTATAASA